MKNSVLSTILIVASLLVGGTAGHFVSPSTVTIEKNVTVEVPVEKIVNQTVDSNAVLLSKALDEYSAYLDDKNLLVCGNNEYSISDVSFGELKEVAISKDTSNRHDELNTVTFKVRDKFADTSNTHPCYRTDDVSVVFHSKSSVDTEVTVN